MFHRPHLKSVLRRPANGLCNCELRQLSTNRVYPQLGQAFRFYKDRQYYRKDYNPRPTRLNVLVGASSALVFSNIEPDRGPNGKTRSEKMLEISQKQLQEDLKKHRERFGPVVAWILTYIWEPFRTFLRFVNLLLLFSPAFLMGLPAAFGIAPHNYKLVFYKFLVFTLQSAGPSFIKLGQWAASRVDVFPQEMCEQLSRLHSNAKQHHLSYTKRIVSESFGKPFEECFEEFDEKPLGVGAMGQVYHALLISDEYQGDVAVKVLHPHVEATVTRDLSIMMILAKMINAIPTMEWLSFPGEVTTFGRMMHSQLDLRLEAENLRIFNEQFKNDEDVSFPKASMNVCTRQMLVEQMVEGVSMEKVLKYANQGPFDRSIATLGLDAFLKMLLLNNFIHSDLHAGNIFLTIDNHEKDVDALKAAKSQEKWDSVMEEMSGSNVKPHLWFIDAGLVTELNLRNRENFVELFKAIATFDGYMAGELLVEKSRTPETVIDKEVFCLKTERLVSQVKKRTFALGSVGIGDLLTKMMDMVRKHHVRMESDFITVVLSILLVEGIGRRLDPELDIFKSSLPVLRKVSQQKASDIKGSGMSMDDMLQMLKVWLVLETRQLITASVQDIYRCVKYDRLSPNN